jgi:hypothetical protein
MNKIVFFKAVQYFLPFAIMLDIYDAIISNDSFHAVVFASMALFSAVLFGLLRVRLQKI